jgi:anti-sigma regulatory factor (Ser/Thr protein kinase)
VRAFRLGLLVGAVVLAIASVWTSTDSLGLGLAAADAVVGLVFVVCGLVASARRTESATGQLMVLAGFAWLTGSLVPVALFWHRGPVVHLCLTFPTGRVRRRFAAVSVVVAYASGLARPLASNDLMTLGVAALVALAAAGVFVGTSGPARRSGLVAMASALAYAGTLAAAALARIAEVAARHAVLLVYDVVVVSIALLLVLELLFGRWTEATVADLVVALGERTGAGTLRDHLARALGDPRLVVGYWIGERGGYVDDLGRPVELPRAADGRVVTEIGDDHQPVAVLVHDAATTTDAQLVAAVAAAARLGVANVRLRAEVQGRLSEVAASRRRIVEAVDAQRRMLQRELSAGAQGRLDGVLRLVVDARCDTVDAGVFDELEVEIRAAQAELRDFAQGIRPSALDVDGLAAAVSELAGRAPVPVELRCDVGRVPPAIEAAVFFVCSEALANVAKHAQAQRVWIAVGLRDGVLVASVTDDGVGGVDPMRGSGLRGLADRVEALGGRIDVEGHPSGGTVVTASIPVDVIGVNSAGSRA